MRVGVLAVQGAFIEHEMLLDKLGVATFEIRQKKDIEFDYDGLILPGGESTVQGKLIHELDLYDGLKERLANGLPVLATCAGLILLAKELSNDEKVYFGTLPVTVRRNAYGRQLGSFYTEEECEGIGRIPMTFIRAPYIEKIEERVKVLSMVNGNIVGVQYQNQIAVSFHPELNNHVGIHKLFLNKIRDTFES